MNIKQTAVKLGTATFMSVSLALSPQVDARDDGGDGSRKGGYGHHDNYGRAGRHGHPKGDYQDHHRGHRQPYRGARHGHHPRHRGYGYYYPPHSYYHDGRLVFGLYWPYGFSVYYEDW